MLVVSRASVLRSKSVSAFFRSSLALAAAYGWRTWIPGPLCRLHQLAHNHAVVNDPFWHRATKTEAEHQVRRLLFFSPPLSLRKWLKTDPGLFPRNRTNT